MTLNINNRKILETIIAEKYMSQNDIAKSSNLNKAVISKGIKELEELNIVSTTQVKNRKYVELNKTHANIILIETDRYEIKGYLNNLIGENISATSIPRDLDNIEQLFNALEKIITTFIKKSKIEIIGIGIAVHGIVNNNFEVKYSPNLGTQNLNLKKPLEAKFNISTFVYNIANVNAITESIYNYPNENNLLSININSGVGAGLFLDDNLFLGSNGASLEFGHMKVHGYNNKCSCGECGCIESIISYPNIVRQLEEAGIENASIPKFINLCNEGCEIAITLYEKYIDLLAFGIENLLLIVNPNTIVVNCTIVRQIPKSIELIKTKITSPMITYEAFEVSTLEEQTHLLGLNNVIVMDYFQIQTRDLSKYKIDVF